jgi:hypothetical protein
MMQSSNVIFLTACTVALSFFQNPALSRESKHLIFSPLKL